MAEHRSGVVAILGRPNAGKSSFLNAVLGQKLAIVTPKPQTTRSRILGIHNLADAQILFLDTPGLHAGEKALNQALNEQVQEAARDCDVALLLVDLSDSWGEDHTALCAELAARGTPLFTAGTKRDLNRSREAAWPAAGVAPTFRISAKTGEGLPDLLRAIAAALPESPPLYPDSDLSDRPLRFLVAELVREAAYEELQQEIPYSLAVEVVEFDETRPELVRIRADLLVERASQKQIAIGQGGAMIKRIGTRARLEIERLLEGRVHLALWVKVEPRWSKRPNRLRALGYV
ncbi:MAG: GTPase Era [Myxococcales bacterium]|nr:GTPase Era [Myxococcales bacterium]MDH5307655.1 GTPase Era [Myxococcales bacterium]MDH5566560.1 GTPase Era [Myxococcales bacterium]